jgi:hydrogenase expression/formation protein HypD
MSGYRGKEKYADFDAEKKVDSDIVEAPENKECIAGDIMKGIKKPVECPQFGKGCTPQSPLGAPMVSSEGACAAYYNFSGIEI